MAGDEGDVDEDAWLTQLRAALAETTADRPEADDVDPLTRLEAVVATDTDVLDPPSRHLQAGDDGAEDGTLAGATGPTVVDTDESLADRLAALEQRLTEFEERQRALVQKLADDNQAATAAAVAEIRQLLFGS